MIYNPIAYDIALKCIINYLYGSQKSYNYFFTYII